MVLEMKLEFVDGEFPDENPMSIVHTLSPPDGFDITGGQIFIENPDTSELQRFSFRVERNEDGRAELTILEDVKSGA